MKIETAVKINGHLVELIGNATKSISLYQLVDDYGIDLFLVDGAGNIISNIRVISDLIVEIKIKELETDV